MKSRLIREKFIQFFTERSHHHQPAAPIVNKDDPSLLFVNAGMNPFKDIILGNQPSTHPRVVTVQPCLRVSGKHNDLEEVGVDTYHHTLFEMLGNWSFGDYFKQEAIQWSWELLTEVYKLPKDRIYVTIFAGDKQDGLEKDLEAAQIWSQYLPENRILPFAKKDNFWEMGAHGPCGPCSEIHIDIRSEVERNAIPAANLVNQDHPHVIEIWNLVFMQYNRLASGKLIDLPNKHIDTGMGFERLAMVLQGKQSNYDTDIFVPLIARIEQISGKQYCQNESIAIAMRVIVDHVRAVVFAIADGQAPSNTKAGYVMRRILRRAVRYGYSYLDMQQPFIYQLVSVLVEQMEGVYANLTLQQDYIEQVIQAEETAFLKTLAAGLHLLNQLDKNKINQGMIDGRVAFELYDTHGFPLDLTALIAKEKGLVVDEIGFQQALQEQKSRSQKDAFATYSDWHIVKPGLHSHFIGYDQYHVTTTIVQWRSVSDKNGMRYQFVLEKTPFYPEGGGQVADAGYMVSGNETIVVLDVQKEHGLIIHTVAQLPTELERAVEAYIDIEKRTLTANNHTATHLLQAALKQILGEHVYQKGSLVTPALLRFDFSYPTKLSPEQIKAVETIVNEKIRENIACVAQHNIPLGAAKAMGAQALFGEKYGEKVRVVGFEGFSIELCGGTHVQSTGQIGLFKMLSDVSIGTGTRRIEAITATATEAFVDRQLSVLGAITTLLTNSKDPVKAVETLIHEKKQLQKQLALYHEKEIKYITDQLQSKLEELNDVCCLIQEVQVPHAEALRQIAFHYKPQHEQMLVVLAAKLATKAHIALLLSDRLQKRLGKNAHDVIKCIAPYIDGNGGGQAFFATARGDKLEGIPIALQAVRTLLEVLGK
ncbi:alanine--tRNA ligase [Cardinium endosymbiont of Culicoides punctatus]|uniref:alanine--tRNA ligase n=1 Tax=Cardinium endosymbiont of Culicoides punctatus TaxID=2304601 RepID=UPI001058E372|nr:alanine--tRNA ligase [Cardinium endosymbiont of Culicoides punctatus]TDG95278.1 Alanine--tRNA ligase [Cardinium endosymbiont of Culicoides punctatus]